MIVTLAGHVDHGKTTLVRLLTGKDTDRLDEEKRRGLTIDLGFAYLNQAGTTLGFVDVPGHHRFIHNMVAGVAARQHALLVVAADDGPMPQSREHLQILQLIGVTHGTIALTKCDRVSPQRVAAARAELRDLVAGTFLEDAAVVETGAETAAGIDELRERLIARAADLRAAPPDRPFRLAVDRAFTLKGAGLVVTGTVHAGRIAVDQEVRTFPQGASARVRSLHVQDQPAQSAAAGDRAAINLAGIDTGALARGHWLCAARDTGHQTLVVDLVLLDDYPRTLRHWSPVHVYHATSHSTARLALMQGVRLEPGARALAELTLDQPLLAKHGDRLVIRDHSLDRTLGGGTVVDNRPRHGRRRTPARLAVVEAYARPHPGDALDALLDLGPVDLDAFQGVWDLLPDALHNLAAQRPATVRQGNLVSNTTWQDWSAALREECEQRHNRDGTLQGLRENDFTAPVPATFRATLLNELTAAGVLEQRAGRYQPKRHHAALSTTEQHLVDRLTPLLDLAQPPSLGDLAKTLHLPLNKLQQAIRPLASKGVVVQINDKRIYLPGHVARLADTAEALTQNGPFSAREFRDAAGIGRNVAIDVLEYFDALGYTRRDGDVRRVVGERSRLLPNVG